MFGSKAPNSFSTESFIVEASGKALQLDLHCQLITSRACCRVFR